MDIMTHLNGRRSSQSDALIGTVDHAYKPGVFVIEPAAIHNGTDDIRDGIVHRLRCIKRLTCMTVHKGQLLTHCSSHLILTYNLSK